MYNKQLIYTNGLLYEIIYTMYRLQTILCINMIVH